VPELPEVETTRRGIEPFVTGHTVSAITVRQRQLRWLISEELETALSGQMFSGVERRAKYLLLRTAAGTLLLHLGMSGRLRILAEAQPAQKHDHVDIEFSDGHLLRFTDPRRFGALLWTPQAPELHPLLSHLGPEPLSEDFHAAYLFRQSRGRQMPVKSFIMDGHIVVGVGNIYANEALFYAGIRPQRAAGRISLKRYELLSAAIKQVLADAIERGGTTLRDFSGSDGNPGYFQQQLQVYGRAGEVCQRCGEVIRVQRLVQRSTFFCARCQH
jgi:formamidopyrimidine-DNA glycosylase